MAKKKGKREEGFTFPEFDKEEFRQKELKDSSSRASNVRDVSCEEEEDPVADRIDYMSDEPRVDLPLSSRI